MKKLINGLTTRLFDFLLYMFGGRKKASYSTTLDDGFVLKDIPSAFPALDSLHSVATDLGSFRVVSTDKENSTVTMRDLETELDFQLSVDAFDVLFIPKTVKTETTS